MQLHHLEMTAIGPYAGTERIDFSAVGRAGLFLLEGPTGSGKSTIIDAITFALYGKVAQASADVERIHSHHADPRTVPSSRSSSRPSPASTGCSAPPASSGPSPAATA